MIYKHEFSHLTAATFNLKWSVWSNRWTIIFTLSIFKGKSKNVCVTESNQEKEQGRRRLAVTFDVLKGTDTVIRVLGTLLMVSVP